MKELELRRGKILYYEKNNKSGPYSTLVTDLGIPMYYIYIYIINKEIDMKNMGIIDSRIRLVLGILLIIAAIVMQITYGRFWWLGLLGVVFTGTSLIRYCPLYLPFGINTKGKEE